MITGFVRDPATTALIDSSSAALLFHMATCYFKVYTLVAIKTLSPFSIDLAAASTLNRTEYQERLHSSLQVRSLERHQVSAVYVQECLISARNALMKMVWYTSVYPVILVMRVGLPLQNLRCMYAQSPAAHYCLCAQADSCCGTACIYSAHAFTDNACKTLPCVLTCYCSTKAILGN